MLVCSQNYSSATEYPLSDKIGIVVLKAGQYNPMFDGSFMAADRKNFCTEYLTAENLDLLKDAMEPLFEVACAALLLQAARPEEEIRAQQELDDEICFKADGLISFAAKNGTTHAMRYIGNLVNKAKQNEINRQVIYKSPHSSI